MIVVYFIIGAFARRWYGGMFPEKEHKILGNRGLQTVFLLGLFISIYLYDITNWRNWIGAIIISAWLQFQFWSRGHGCCFDLGRGGKPESVARYNERWYHKPCDWLFKVLGVSDYRYGFLYDFLYMNLRYTCPMVPLMLLDWRYILVGFSVTPIYAFCWTLYEKEPWLRPCPSWIDRPTKWAELLAGGIVYAGCYYLGAF